MDTSNSEHMVPGLDPITLQDYTHVVKSVKDAIDGNAHPIRIGQGSSGSYFCRNLDGQIVGVFKPKDEEPYGTMNPKWTKWIHRNLFFCCFGRSCLVPNVGFLSEAGASLLDERLGFGLVPRTEVVYLSSSAFHYSSSQRKRNEFAPKVGSFQLYLKGFQDASLFLKIHPLPSLPPMQQSTLFSPAQPPRQKGDHTYAPISQGSTSIIHGPEVHPLANLDEVCGIWNQRTFLSFLHQFQRLTILDYIMRNTDRGLDNWMIKHQHGKIQIAAIDHGLAFPYKHPDKWRSYPYGWLYLKIAHYPFLSSIRNYMHDLLTDPQWWSITRAALYDLFRSDPDVPLDMIENQISVIRGQVYNLYHCMSSSPAASPMDLWFRPPIIVVRQPRVMVSPQHHCVEIDGHHCLGELSDEDILIEEDLEHIEQISQLSSMKGQVKAMWQKGKQKMRDGSHHLLNRARNVILEATKKPWFRHW
ncbi:phosphatidyl inositol kinase [Coelomomyces lativittatus]|nr:phosphatidyl inositol kinase [Coelomomyces lativittatus]